MSIEQSPQRANSLSNAIFGSPKGRSVASYERELAKYRRAELRLRERLARNKALLRQKDEFIQHQQILSQESDHRLLNGMQMIASLLSLQSRASENAEVASQLAVAANRVATIARVHQDLHNFDGVQTLALKQYIEDLCRDMSAMLSTEKSSEQTIAVEGIEINLPTATGIPLGFIVNELITNAVKYGTGRITVRLESNPGAGYALSVSNDGPPLPKEFDPTVRKGLGMTIIRFLVERIDGKLRIARADETHGTQFTVLFH
jgi:two-component sensor histidine kinase